MKYRTLPELINALHAHEITGHMIVDNDNATFINVDKENDPDWEFAEDVFEMHPEELLEECLTLLQIPWEHV